MKTIAQIKEEFQNTPPERLPGQIAVYKADSRTGVQKLCQAAEKRYQAYQAELARIEELCHYEKEYEALGAVCGIDEVGRGPLAGPVVAGAVILPKGCRLPYINDSKQLTAKKREELDQVIRENAVAFALGTVSPERIDEINILQATYEAMRQAIAGLSVRPAVLLNDAVTIPQVDIRQVPIVKGDAKSISIGAASILAKVARDHMMEEYDKIYPGYAFAGNKGYGSQEHIAAIGRLGPCPIHRKSFLSGIRSGTEGTGEGEE